MRNNCNDFYQYKFYDQFKKFLECTLIVRLIWKFQFYDHE